jgi:hypothetical protein
MMVGVLVLPEVTVGIIEASITRSRSSLKTRTARRLRLTRVGTAVAHLGRADGMKDRGADLCRPLYKAEGVPVVADREAGQELSGR